MLGFSRERHYFDGEIFAKGESVVMTVEGFVLDLSNPDSNSISQSIMTELKDNKFGNAVGLSNYYLRGNAAHIAGTGPGVDGVWGTQDDLDHVKDIVINGINYGKGRILSIESTSSSQIREDKIYVGKYVVSIEFFYSLGSAIFSVQGTGDYYHNLETILEPYAHKLEQFSEGFEYSRGANGEENYTHNISIKVRDDGTPWGTVPGSDALGGSRVASPQNIGAYIAWWIYKNSQPSFPLTTMGSFDLNDDTGIGNSPHDAFYNETYDTVSGACTFSKRWKKQLTQEASDATWSIQTHAFLVDDIEYTVSFTYQITQNDGFCLVMEKGDILRVGGGLSGDGRRKVTPSTSNVYKYVLDTFRGGANARCVDAREVSGIDGSLAFLQLGGIETKFFEAPQEHRFGYETTFTDDPQILDTYGGFKVEKKLSIGRDPMGVNTLTNEASATPIRKATIYGDELSLTDPLVQRNLKNQTLSNHDVGNLLELVAGGLGSGSFPSINFDFSDGWARYFVDAFGYNPANFKLMKTQTDVTPMPAFTTVSWNTHRADVDAAYTYKISLTQTWSDDKTVTNLWNGSYSGNFTRKLISIDNAAPVKKKQSYMVAGWGEVLHTSPQSEVGNLTINFQGTLRRRMNWNSQKRGSVLGQTDMNAAIAEAQLACMSYFGSVVNPTHMFITDTNYSVNSGREFTMAVVLSYTKGSYTTALETR